MEGEKECRGCLKIKPLDAFWLRNDVKGGRRSRCKVCEAQAYQVNFGRLRMARASVADRLEKKCSRCHTVKPLGDFWADRKSRDGHSYLCIECRREQYREGTGAPEDPPDRKAIFHERYLRLYRVKQLLCGRPIPHGILAMLLPM